ncbi:MAG TPA: hotdog domain-containing protein [Mycobacteriales bacterium]|nr:hotdog domain-containing protein [Mycobacteriales bacterium]
MDIGLSASVRLVVGEQDTAVALGSGDVPVLGTPRVVALVEEATVAAVRDALAPTQTTVGTRVDVEHLRASAVGATVEVLATLEIVEGSRLQFAVAVTQDGREVARGRVTRQVVDRERFLSRL